MTRHQLRAARALLVLKQDLLAAKAGVGVATIRRFENGVAIDDAIVDRIRVIIERQGALLIRSGNSLDGLVAGEGVFLKPDSELPQDTKDRRAAIDLTPEQASALLPSERRGKVGRRTRVPDDPDQGSAGDPTTRLRGSASRPERATPSDAPVGVPSGTDVKIPDAGGARDLDVTTPPRPRR